MERMLDTKKLPFKIFMRFLNFMSRGRDLEKPLQNLSLFNKGLSINDVTFGGRGSQKVTKSDGGGAVGLFSKPKVTSLTVVYFWWEEGVSQKVTKSDGGRGDLVGQK